MEILKTSFVLFARQPVLYNQENFSGIYYLLKLGGIGFAWGDLSQW